MGEAQPGLEVTPKVVVVGEKVIHVHQIVSLGRDQSHPFRPIGLAGVALGAGLLANEFYLKGLAAFSLKTSGSLPLWVGFGAAGIGLFLTLFVRRPLVVRTADGARTVIPAESDELASAIVQRIRMAMEGGTSHAQAALPHHASPPQPLSTAEPQQGRLTSSPAPLGLPPAGAGGPGGQSTGGRAHPHTVPVGRRIDGPVNGHPAGRPFSHGPGGEQPAANDIVHAGARTTRPGAAGEAAGGALTSAELAPREQPLALPSTLPPLQARDDGARELAHLMDHLRRADVQHKEALLDLLRVIEDHYRGRASREDAVAHWRSFADYVVQYLSDVDGLIAQTERFGRHMLVR